MTISMPNTLTGADRAVLARLEAKTIRRADGGCWIWTGDVDHRGYGRLKVDGRMRSMHRLSYALLVGDLVDGLVVHHTCSTRRCWRPRSPAAGDRQAEHSGRRRTDRGPCSRHPLHCRAPVHRGQHPSQSRPPSLQSVQQDPQPTTPSSSTPLTGDVVHLDITPEFAGTGRCSLPSEASEH